MGKPSHRKGKSSGRRRKQGQAAAAQGVERAAPAARVATDSGLPSDPSMSSAAVDPERMARTAGPVPRELVMELLSDTTFGRGEGTAGLVDTEVEHDPFGLPYVSGKTVRGLLRDSWLSMQGHFPELAGAAERVLGRSRTCDDGCRLRVGDAQLPTSVRSRLQWAVTREDYPLRPEEVLASLTTIRRQTAEERAAGAPAEATLRASRVMLRGLKLCAPLAWMDGYAPKHEDLKVLALAALATRHGGLLRNRGRGHLRLSLDDDLSATQGWAEVGS